MFNDPFLADWHNTTTLHPIGVAATVVLGIALLLVPRRYALVPMLIMACFISPAQRVVILSLDFTLLRLLVLFGWARVLMRHEVAALRWRPLDTVVVAWCGAGTIAALLLHASGDMVIHRLGILYDIAGMYFLFRVLVRDWKDVETIASSAALLSLPVMVLMLIEKGTGRNLFSVLGGVPELTNERNGRLRCQGAFGHPILAGCFWVAMLPLFAALWWRGGWRRFLAPIAAVTTSVIVYACSSSTPLSALVMGCGAAMLFPLRHWLGWVRWAAALTLLALHLIMLQPVWHLIARINLVSGSTGWYRYKLIDAFIRHFSEWWLIGTTDYISWYEHNFNALTNQYVLEGVNGGLVTLALFVGVIVVAFRGLGRMQRSLLGRPSRLAMAWALGVSLFVHCLIFIGVAYVGQILMIWYLTLAMIGSMSAAAPPRRIAAVRPSRDARAGPAADITPVIAAA